MGIIGTHIVKALDVNATFYRDGTGSGDCPSVRYADNYYFDKIADASLEVMPEPFLHCFGIFYEVQSVAWTVSE
jgi:hypothetical protein